MLLCPASLCSCSIGASLVNGSVLGLNSAPALHKLHWLLLRGVQMEPCSAGCTWPWPSLALCTWDNHSPLSTCASSGLALLWSCPLSELENASYLFPQSLLKPLLLVILLQTPLPSPRWCQECWGCSPGFLLEFLTFGTCGR